jgi:hypothetical protein
VTFEGDRHRPCFQCHRVQRHGAEVHGKYTIDGTTVREGKASGPYGVLTITDR